MTKITIKILGMAAILRAASAFARGAAGPALPRLRALSAAAAVTMPESAAPAAVAWSADPSALPAAWAGDALVVPLRAAPKPEGADDDDDAGEDPPPPPLDERARALDAALDGALSDLIAAKKFAGNDGETAVAMLPKGAKARRLALFGLGPPPKEKAADDDADKDDDETDGDAADGAVPRATLAKLGGFVAQTAKAEKAASVAVDCAALGGGGDAAGGDVARAIAAGAYGAL